MTGQECITKFENMVDDVLDTDFALQLMNDAKTEIESSQIWEILKSSQNYSVASGYSYTSALGTLPTDFAFDLSVVEGTSNLPYEKVAFEDLMNKANIGNGYFIDLANNNFYLAGQNHSAKTITLFYAKTSTDITISTSWVFPTRFHSLLPLKMAQIYYAADGGEKTRSWDDRWAVYYSQMFNNAVVWNDSLKLRNKRSISTQQWDNPKGINM